jgi:hypothetical protein
MEVVKSLGETGGGGGDSQRKGKRGGSSVNHAGVARGRRERGGSKEVEGIRRRGGVKK